MPGDAAPIWQLVRASGVLDPNSPYAYLLLCSHFAATGAVATAGDAVVGFALGYRLPDDPAAWFVWQVGVAESQRGRGLGGALLDHVIARGEPPARFLEATVTPSNAASWALFRGFAARRGAPLRERAGFAARLFPDGGHEDEIAIRIGPFGSGAGSGS